MMYIEEIKSVLPHRYPFLLVDRIVSLVPGESICGYKNVTTNEEFLMVIILTSQLCPVFSS